MTNWKRCEKPKPDTSIDLSLFRPPCDTWHALNGLIDALRRKKLSGAECDLSRFEVQFQLIDSMTYMFVLTDKEAGEVYQWSVPKDYLKESPERAFERALSEAKTRYNQRAYRSLQDIRDDLAYLYPTAKFHLYDTEKGFRIYRPVAKCLGFVPFEISYNVAQGPIPQDRALHPEIFDILETFPTDLAHDMDRYIIRLQEAGVVFYKYENEAIEQYERKTILGWARRTEDTHFEVNITWQDIYLKDEDLITYHQYMIP